MALVMDTDRLVRCYRFRCPECGLTDAESGIRLTVEEIHCVVCLNEEERHVVVRRWVEDDDRPDAG